MDGSMKKCCSLCPYSRKNTLFLHPERAQEFADQTQNPYNDFVCHKTGEIIDDGNEWSDGDIVRGEESLVCKGFESLQWQNNPDYFPEDYKPDPNAFGEDWEMVEHHAEEWEKRRKK